MSEKADDSSGSGKRRRKVEIPPFVMLAWWQVRPTWRLLAVMCGGIIVAVAFVCTVPLYSDVAMTAGLRSAFSGPTESPAIVVTASSEQLDTMATNQATKSLDSLFTRDLGSYINPVELSIQLPDDPLMQKANGANGKAVYELTFNTMTLVSAPAQTIAPHVTLLHGRLPGAASGDIEVALTAESAAILHVGVGSSLLVQVSFVAKDSATEAMLPPLFVNVPLHVVGIINPTPVDDPYWHATTFLSSVSGAGAKGTDFTGLTSSEGMLAYFTELMTQSNNGLYKFQSAATLHWYYLFSAPDISIYDVNNLDAALSVAGADVVKDMTLYNSPLIEQPEVTAPYDVLQRFEARTPVVAIPTTGLLLVVVGLILFFVSLISDVLIEQQSETIALLRSRGANRRQVFGVFTTQSVGAGVVGLLVGPVLAFGLVSVIVLFTLPGAERGAVNIVFTHFGQMFVKLGWYPLLAMLVAIATSVLAIAQRVSSTILSVRREAARATSRPLWQRLRLDVVAAVVALVSSVFLVYLLNSSFLTTRLNLLLLTPLTMLSVFFLALALILLFLRLYPLLLQLGARMTMRRRGAAHMLALVQMARAPRQTVRVTLLLSLAIGCMVFLFVFIASQSQRIPDVASFQAGADFSGTLRDNGFAGVDMQKLTGEYAHVPGILSASVGYVTTAQAVVGGNTNNAAIQINAVDSDTFARTAFWREQDTAEPLSALLSELITQRPAYIASGVIPAVVDEAMWNMLQLTPGAQFTLIFNNGDVVDGQVNFVAIAEAQDIPTIIDSAEASGTDDYVVGGGMLVDYQTFAQVYTRDFSDIGVAVPVNYVWLRTRDDEASVQHIRNVLSDPKGCCLQLLNMHDRRAIAASLESDPLYLDVVGLLGIGALITILLMLLGNLFASWWNVRSRLAQFAMLQALGASPGQVKSILLWEQAISFITGIVLGLLFGVVLVVSLLPSLVYTGGVSNSGDLSTGQFYLVQHVPPIQVVLPGWLLLLLLVLLLVFVATFIMIVRVARDFVPAQILRLNVD